MLADAWNRYFLPRFKGYEKTEIIFDVSELPEMQQDVAEMVGWLSVLIDKGTVNRDEVREAIGFNMLETPEMEAFTVASDVIPLAEAIDSDFNVTSQPEMNGEQEKV